MTYSLISRGASTTVRTVSLLDECTVGVDAAPSLGLQIAQPQDVLDAIQGHLHYFGVHQREQITQGFYAA